MEAEFQEMEAQERYSAPRRTSSARREISRSFDRLEGGLETTMHVGTLGMSYLAKKLFSF